MRQCCVERMIVALAAIRSRSGPPGTSPLPPLYHSWAREGACKDSLQMNKLMMSAAALAVCLGASAAIAQDTDKSTTVTMSPSGRTETTVTTTSDGYKQYVRTTTATKHYQAGAYVGPSGYVY